MSKYMHQASRLSSGLLGNLNLMERLLRVRKRKRAWAGQAGGKPRVQRSPQARQQGKPQA